MSSYIGISRETIKAYDYNIKKIILNEVDKLGTKCDLNHIDVSDVTNIDELFRYISFNGDISNWDVRNVKTMIRLFMFNEIFNGDISKWNVSNVTSMDGAFRWSKFNGDISQWDVSNVTDMSYMFYGSQFNGDISQWNVSNVKHMSGMFRESKFNGDISNWNVEKLLYTIDIIHKSPLEKNPPYWIIKELLFGNFHNKYEESISEWNWIDENRKIIWKKRLEKALKEFGKEGAKLPNSIGGYIYY